MSTRSGFFFFFFFFFLDSAGKKAEVGLLHFMSSAWQSAVVLSAEASCRLMRGVCCRRLGSEKGRGRESKDAGRDEKGGGGGRGLPNAVPQTLLVA